MGFGNEDKRCYCTENRNHRKRIRRIDEKTWEYTQHTEDLPPSLPEGATLGDVLVEGASGVEWSDRLTDAENEIDAEIVNRAADDLLEKNARIAADNAEALARANADALKLDKPPSPNNISTRVVNADNSTSEKGEFQLSEQIEIATNTTAQASWRGKEIWVTASCTLTIPEPATLPDFWSIDVYVLAGTLTHAITTPGSWIGSTPPNAGTESFYRIVRRGSTNNFKVLGL